MTSESGLIPALLDQIKEMRYEGRVVSVDRVDDLREAIEGHHRQGLLDEELFQNCLTNFHFYPPDDLPGARSLIVVAVPRPRTGITFAWDGIPVQLTVPPTYLHYREADREVGALLAQVLEPAGYRVAQAVLPEKLLAVCSGLAAYGKNNISYVPGMGSFHQLVLFYSDLPCPEDDWRQPTMMDQCQTCSACLRHCPTGAISPDRFLLRAERCITFRNEKPGDVPFPAWLDPAWHNCLVGCLHCQRVCPQNRDVWGWVEEGASFSEQETALLLQGVPLGQLPAETVEKLQQSDMIDQLDFLPRNLNVLLRVQRSE